MLFANREYCKVFFFAIYLFGFILNTPLNRGVPDRVQIDNALSFFGSRRHPRGMGALIRFCLHNGVEPWFIPMAEPWRNGMVENFNERYQQRFLGKVTMISVEEFDYKLR